MQLMTEISEVMNWKDFGPERTSFYQTERLCSRKYHQNICALLNPVELIPLGYVQHQTKTSQSD